MEVFSNFGQSTLGSAISNSQTTLTVASATNFPTSGNFRILVESEIMKVTAVSGTTFTVSRGQESTSAVAHNSGVTVTAIITAAALAAFRADDVTLDVIANRPAAGTAGRLFIPSDNTGSISYDDGSNWNALGLHSYFLTPTTTGTFGTSLGNGSPTFSQNGDCVVLDLVGTASGSLNAAKVKSVTPQVTITTQVSLQYLPSGTGNFVAGLIIRDSSTGNTRLFGWRQNTTTRQFGVHSFTYSGGSFSFGADISVTGNANNAENHRFLRIFQPTSSNRTYQVSADGQNWTVWLSEAFNTGAASVDQAGFLIFFDTTYNAVSNAQADLIIRSYKET